MSFSGSSEYSYEDDEKTGIDLLLPVPSEFINDPFNLIGIDKQIPDYQQLLPYIQASQLSSFSQQLLNLYGLIHKRYIQSEDGLQKLAKAIRNDVLYLTCPVFGCNCRLIPTGVSDLLGEAQLFGYCTKCNELYVYPNYCQIDGAFFGENLAQLILLRFPKLEQQLLKIEGNKDDYAGKQLFGFQISRDALQEKAQQLLGQNDS